MSSSGTTSPVTKSGASTTGLALGGESPNKKAVKDNTERKRKEVFKEWDWKKCYLTFLKTN